MQLAVLINALALELWMVTKLLLKVKPARLQLG